jgi:uncharacterized membrane protein YheB (UPF0754 family)
MWQWLQDNSELFMYLSIPVTSAVVGWGTNVLALKMMFYPLEFFGIKPFIGWQGIIPSKAEKMAKISVDLWTEKLINVKDMFSRIKPDAIAEEMRPEFDRIAKEMMDEVMEDQIPQVWAKVPEAAKGIAYARMSRDLPNIISEIMNDIKENIEEVFDLKDMIVSRLTSDKAMMNEIFLKCGKEEFKFIELSGIYFGFGFGLIQMAVWYFFPEWWILPLCGLLVGYGTNWLALKLIFQPIEPKRILGIKFQGLFIKRQKEVAAEYANILANDILTFDRIFAAIINGPTKDRFVKLIQDHTNQAIDDAVGMGKPMIKLIGGQNNYDRIKDIASQKVVRELPKTVKPAFGYAEESMDLENVMRERMIKLSPKEFVGFLRPVFQEDELKLILVGAVLGCAAGVAQLVFVFGGW